MLARPVVHRVRLVIEERHPPALAARRLTWINAFATRNLSLTQPTRDEPNPAALALIKLAEDTGIRFEPAVAKRVAADVDGYPYFIQKYERRCGTLPTPPTSRPLWPSSTPIPRPRPGRA